MPSETTAHLQRSRRFIVPPLLFVLLLSAAFFPTSGSAHPAVSSTGYTLPTWWAKYQQLLKGTGASASLKTATTSQIKGGPNVDMSNEDGPQSETSITVNPNNTGILVGGSNEIFRLPMRGYFSNDGGKSWSGVDLPLPPPATTNGTDFGSDPGVAFDDGIPAMASRRALLYPACDADRSSGANRGTLYCSWMDETPANGTDIFVARSATRGAKWSGKVRVNDDPAGVGKDQFNQWLSVDPVTGSVNLSWNDARNDPNDVKTDIYFAQSTNGGLAFAPNVKVTTAMSDESSANPDADAGNQYGDYEGIVALGGRGHPIKTDGRFDSTVDSATGQLSREEDFTAAIRA